MISRGRSGGRLRVRSRPAPWTLIRGAVKFIAGVLIPACVNWGGGGGGEGNLTVGGESGGDDGQVVVPNPSGDLCSALRNSDPSVDLGPPFHGGLAGWTVACHVDSAHYNRTNLHGDPELITEIIDEDLHEKFPGAIMCCEGCAAPEWKGPPDQECQALCAWALCLEAAAWHDDNNIEWPCFGLSCEFDMESCFDAASSSSALESTSSQTLKAAVPWVSWVQYELQFLGCQDARAVMYPQDPATFCIDETSTLPPACQVPEDLGRDPMSPFGNLAQNSVEEGAGSYAELSWATDTTSGKVRTEDLDILVDYQEGDCGGVPCIELAQLTASLPQTNVEGYLITDAILALQGLAQEPLVDRQGTFNFEPGALEVVVSGRVGGIPFVASARNTTQVVGTASRGANHFGLHNLAFEFRQADITAKLFVELSGTYTARAPQTTIAVLDAPSSCALPVAFNAASTDLDGGQLTHLWLVPSVGTSFPGTSATGALFELTMTNRQQTLITLTARDATGRWSSAALNYTRNCR